jgi:uridine kinase
LSFLGPWRVAPLSVLVDLVRAHVGAPEGRAPVVAVDGRSSSGKTTLARRLQHAIPGAATIHTDDIAWWHSCFDWADLLVDGVLEPLRSGRPVAYRPPAWDERDRPGAIEVAATAPLIIVEGVGAGRRELAGLLDGVLWVESAPEVRLARDRVRIADGEIDQESYSRWMQEEEPFVADQRAWERAFAVVAGSPELPFDATTEVVLGTPPRRRSA